MNGRADRRPADWEGALREPCVLVTDDDADFRAIVCEALSSRGLKLLQASDGEEALRLIENQRPHLVLLDHHMPRRTGLEVIEILSHLDQPMPYVLMSAMLDEAIEREAIRMRAYKVLHKPLRVSQIRQIVCGGLADVYGWKPS